MSIETNKNKVDHGNRWMPIMYATYYGIMKEIAEKYGYALAIHGTMTRDLDLIVVPWVEQTGDVIEMFKEFNKAIGYGKEGAPYSSRGEKAHGRIAYTLPTGSGGYVDISVMPCLDNTSKIVFSKG